MASYLNNGAKRLEYELGRIKKDVKEPNKTYLLKFKDYLELNSRKERTQERRLMELRTICKLNVCKDFEVVTKEDVEEVVKRLNKLKIEHTNKDVSEYSKARTKLTFKNFIKWLTGSDKYVSWIKATSRMTTAKLPEDILTEEDVEKLLNACTNQRDKTLIALLWDSGCRVGELLNIKVKDVAISESTASYVIVTGKTGTRRTPLSVSVPFIATYINQSRKSAKPEEPLFLSLSKSTPLDYDAVRMILTDSRKRAGLSKRIHSHIFRYSRCVYLHKNGMPSKALELFFGWSDLKMVDHYSRLSGADVDNAFYKALGMKTNGEHETSKLTVKRCYKCHTNNETTAKYCINCGTNLDINVIQEINEMDEIKKELEDIRKMFKIFGEDKELSDKIRNLLANKIN